MFVRRDIFTRAVRGIRRRYALVALCFLALSIALFHMGGPWAFGWYDFFAVFTLVLLVVVLFLLHGNSVLAPIERLTEQLESMGEAQLKNGEILRLNWNGKDEFALLAASIDHLIESIQVRDTELREENRHFRDIISCYEIELAVMNRHGTLLNILHCPQGVAPVPGLTRGFEPDANIWGKANRKALDHAIEQAFGENRRGSDELAFQLGNGKLRRVKVMVARPDDGIFVVVMFRDLPESAEPAEPLRAVSDARLQRMPVQRLAAGLAKDFGGLLESICVDTTAGCGGAALAEARTLVDDLRIVAGEMEVRASRYSATHLAASVREQINAAVAGSGVRVNYSLPADLPIVVADGALMDRAFREIVRNSLESFGSIPGTIDVSAAAVTMTRDTLMAYDPHPTSETGVLFTFADDGPGIAGSVRQDLFEPYCTTHKNVRGLGLPVALAIVRAHGGGIRVESVRGRGTTVEIFLPISSRMEESAAERSGFAGGEVLVVDDNACVLKIATALLRTQQVAAHVAGSRHEALRKFGELSSWLRAVFLDVQLGESKTGELLAGMRKINPRVPIVVVSGYSESQIRDVYRESPYDAFLSKPYTVAELKSILEKFPSPNCGKESEQK